MLVRRTLIFVTGSLACLIGGVNLSTQADTSETSPLVTWEEVPPQRVGVVLWVMNPSADTVRVDSLHVEACLNIRRGGCGVKGLDLVLAPGGRKELLRLLPAVPRDAFSYQWFLDWRVVSPDSVKTRRRKPSIRHERTRQT